MRNVTEELAAELYRELLPQVPEAHDCPVCREDAMVYALNRLPPHYVATRKGEVVSRVGVLAGQSRTDGLVVMMDALRFVAANPRCGRAPAAPA
jgi:competence protein ComFB